MVCHVLGRNKQLPSKRLLHVAKTAFRDNHNLESVCDVFVNHHAQWLSRFRDISLGLLFPRCFVIPKNGSWRVELHYSQMKMHAVLIFGHF